MPHNFSLRLAFRLPPRHAVLLGLAALSVLAAPAAHAQSLFVGNALGNSITEFAAGTIPGTFGAVTNFGSGYVNFPTGLAFDSKGNLFAANINGVITKFAPGTISGTFGTGTVVETGLSEPYGLAFDSKGDLFAANYNGSSITEFAAGVTPGTFGAATSFGSGSLNNPIGLAFDSKGDLFAANEAGSSNSGSITEFAAGVTPGTFGAVTSFGSGSLNNPQGLAFDSKGNLFTANFNGGSGSITEFTAGLTPGTFGAVTSFGSSSVSGPNGLAFDSKGDLFAANAYGGSGSGSITEFAAGLTPGTFGAVTSFGNGSLNNPIFLAFGPPAPAAPVPEASTVISLGLLLILGLGGMVVARRKSVRA